MIYLNEDMIASTEISLLYIMTILHLGMTPLHYSAEYGHVAVVKYLVGTASDVNIKDRNGEYRVYQS